MCQHEDFPCCGCDDQNASFYPEDSCEELDGLNGDVPDDEDFDDEGYQMSDVEADADTLKSAGWGTDEDYDFGNIDTPLGEDYGGE